MTIASVIAGHLHIIRRAWRPLLLSVPAIYLVTLDAQPAQPFNPVIPKVWDEAALTDWATPGAFKLPDYQR
jgi:hypothetical protein